MKRIALASGAQDRGSRLRRLSGTPGFARYVRLLPAPEIAELVLEIGAEDSEEVFAALDAAQFREVMSTLLWTTGRAGQPEVLDVTQFVRWVERWLLEGDAIVTRRICDLGEELVLVCLRRLICAADRAHVLQAQGLAIGDYRVSPLDRESWPVMHAALVALWSEDPDFVLRVVSACCPTASILDESRDGVAGDDADYQDLLADRQARRTQRGFVGAADAAMFLMAAAAMSPDETSVHASDLPVALRGLPARRPDFASRRIQELAFLCNVLMAGGISQGRALRESEAASLVKATVMLGADYLARTAPVSSLNDRGLESRLNGEPGAVRLFQVGFALLSRIPLQCCEAIYRAKDLLSRRRGHVVQVEMEELLGASILTCLVGQGRHGDAKLVIDGLTACMDSVACVALRTLIDHFPAYPLALDHSARRQGPYVDRGCRPITCTRDLDRIAGFLAALPDRCG